uniref:Uncharacterized protein n=1 Tax=Podoviridae sp. ct2iq11 TaxID=2827720 RepID=A0A8S5TPK0_9CAUD|nr:MAG TPA: hypothetical protein [Podoviridae sp. ct2iq11]
MNFSLQKILYFCLGKITDFYHKICMNFDGKNRGFCLWTVDTAGWTDGTEASVQLFTTLSFSYCLEVDRRDKKFVNKINRLQRLCPALSRIGNKNRHLRGQVDRAPENTSIYYIKYLFYFSVPSDRLTWGIYFFITVQNKIII